MRNWIDFGGRATSRRDMLGLLGGAAALTAMPTAARAQREPSADAVLNDPDNPVFGKPRR